MMLNNGHDYNKLDFSKMDKTYSNMYKLYYKLYNEYIYNSYHNVMYWENIWNGMAKICYIICVENEAYIDDYFSGQLILYNAIRNIDKLSYGYYHDIASIYISINGGIVPSISNIKYNSSKYNHPHMKYEFFNKLVEYSRPIATSTNHVDNNYNFQSFPSIDLSFVY